MKIVIASSFVPFVNGGGRFIVEWLEQKLREYGHSVERFYIPFIDRPDDLFDQILAFRLIDVSSACDRLIAIRPPAHVLEHPVKVLWFIHHIRSLYDLWDSPYRFVPDDPSGRGFRAAMIDIDTRTIREARHVFTNSQVVANRLIRFNNISAKPFTRPSSTPAGSAMMAMGMKSSSFVGLSSTSDNFFWLKQCSTLKLRLSCACVELV